MEQQLEESERETSHKLSEYLDSLLIQQQHNPSIASLWTQQLKSKVVKSLSVIHCTLKTYPLSKLAFSFNGGKDCTALLHLLHLAFKTYKDEVVSSPFPVATLTSLSLQSILTLYFAVPDSFSEVDDFIQQCVKQYELNLRTTNYQGFRECVENGEVQAIFMGTRKTDPNGVTLKYFSPTDKGWPPCMRVNPVLEWTYEDIWNFIRLFNVPYCSLYDKGYTSLGSKFNTNPHPSLRKQNGTYEPAYKLTEEQGERIGRQSGISTDLKQT